MTPSEIISQQAKKQGENADILLRKIDKVVKSKAGILLQKNDTLMLLISLAQTAAEAHVFSVDDKPKLIEALHFFKDKFLESDLKALYFQEAPNQPIGFKDMGLPVQKSNVKGYTGMIRK